MANDTVFYATGRRKTSAARVFLKPGTGKITINGREPQDYVQTASRLMTLNSPFQVAGAKGQFDAYITVKGGGLSGQVGAIRQGLSRALTLVDSEKNRPVLKKAGYLTRDDRMVERKKYGHHKARKSTQFSKR